MILIERSIQRINQITEKCGRVFPNLFNSTVGVQPMTQPQGIYFALRYIYSNNGNNISNSAGYTMMDVSSLYPSSINVNLKITPLKYKREFVWHRSRKKKM